MVLYTYIRDRNVLLADVLLLCIGQLIDLHAVRS